MSIKEWFRKQITAISLAVSNVEKSVFNQDKKSIGEASTQESKYMQGTLADALINGEVTQEVKNLRWRTYKILRESGNVCIEKSHVDDNGNTYYRTIKNNGTEKLRKLKVDSVDTYPVEFVFYNPEITFSLSDRLESLKGSETIDIQQYSITNKSEVPLVVSRLTPQRFDIEKYTKRLIVRKIKNNKRLLEFYVSKYGYPDNPNSIHFSRELQKLIDGTLINKDFLDIKEVGLLTQNTIGVIDYLIYQYEIVKFDKIIEYDGNYVVKFIADVLIDGVDALSDFVEKELEEKYKSKSPKKFNTI